VSQRIYLAVLLLSFAVFAYAKTPPPPTLEVGTCLNGYTHFTTIQLAVNAAPAGATILVCPGIYPEQVVIGEALTLKGVTLAGASGATVAPPPGAAFTTYPNLVATSFFTPIAPQVLIQNTKNVALTNLTVDGTNDGIQGCSPYLVGVLFQNASGSLSDMAVVNQILGPGLTGCQGGLAILVQSGGGGTSKVDVADSVVQNFAKNGITGSETGTKLTIERTSIIGIGLTTMVAQNGVEFGFGATGSITDSTVADFAYSDVLASSAVGILLVGSPGVTVKNNVVANTETGVYTFSEGADGSASGATITNNEISATHTWDGIALCSNSNTVTGNTINGSDESGVFIGGFCTEPNGSASGTGNKIKSNTINSACAGLMFSYGATPAGNTATGNTFLNVGTTVLTADVCPGSPMTLVTSSSSALAGGGGGGGARLKASPVR
jgi:Right handed beta helix region